MYLTLLINFQLKFVTKLYFETEEFVDGPDDNDYGEEEEIDSRVGDDPSLNIPGKLPCLLALLHSKLEFY